MTSISPPSIRYHPSNFILLGTSHAFDSRAATTPVLLPAPRYVPLCRESRLRLRIAGKLSSPHQRHDPAILLARELPLIARRTKSSRRAIQTSTSRTSRPPNPSRVSLQQFRIHSRDEHV